MRTAISAKKRKSTNLTLIFRGNHSAIAEEMFSEDRENQLLF
jgi:hypothetical protein